MEQGIKDQTLNSKCMPHLLAQIPQMKDLIFRVKIFPENTVQVSLTVPILHQLNLLTVVLSAPNPGRPSKYRGGHMLG